MNLYLTYIYHVINKHTNLFFSLKYINNDHYNSLSSFYFFSFFTLSYIYFIPKPVAPAAKANPPVAPTKPISPVAPADCSIANKEPAATFPIVAWAAAAADPAAIPEVVNPPIVNAADPATVVAPETVATVEAVLI